MSSALKKPSSIRPSASIKSSAPSTPSRPSTASSTRSTSSTVTKTPAKKAESKAPPPGAARYHASDDATSHDWNNKGLPEAGSEEFKAKTRVMVTVRMRPISEKEKKAGQQEAWCIRNNSTIFQTFMSDTPLYSPPGISLVPPAASTTGPASGPKPLAFVYDHIFTPERTNSHVFDRMGKPLVENAMNGVNGVLFAYGQTAAGKTHTIHGTKDDPGMIPRTVEAIFDYIEATPAREFVLRVAYLEIYNEIINDLLNPLATNLAIREDRQRGTFVGGLKEEVVMSAEQVCLLYCLMFIDTARLWGV